MNDDMIWAYRAVFKQTAGGGGTIQVNVSMNEKGTLLYGSLGPNDYAADRTLEGLVVDSADNIITKMYHASPFDNESLSFPAGSLTAIVPDAGADFSQLTDVGKSDVFVFKALSVVQNEELTLNIRIRISTTKPTVSTTGSGGTVTTTLTYDKVI